MTHGHWSAQPGDSPLEFERLTPAHVSELASFLDRTWRAAYGANPFPLFNATYLRWLYGGPRGQTTRLVGYRVNGELRAFRAYLAREILLRGRLHRGFLSTHFAVDKQLPGVERRRLIEAMTLLPWQSSELFPSVDLTYGTLEVDKALAAKATAIYTSLGLSVTTGQFAQSVVTVPGQREVPPVAVRRASAEDAGDIAALHDRWAGRCDLAQRLTTADIAHHWFGAPDAEVYVTDGSDGMSGALCVYRLEMVTAGGVVTVAIIEGFLAADVPAAVALLQQAHAYRQRVGARGLVCENATYLERDFCRACGLLPTLRHMRLLMAAPSAIDLGESWLLDVK